MFSNLRQDSLLYILNKKEGMTLMTANNIRVGNPYPKFTQNAPLGGIPMLVDIEAESNGDKLRFTQIPATQTSHEYNGIFITESREAMQAEIEGVLARCEEAINSYDSNVKTAERCRELLPQVNPAIARDRQNEDRMHSLETRVDGLDGKLSEILALLKKSK